MDLKIILSRLYKVITNPRYLRLQQDLLVSSLKSEVGSLKSEINRLKSEVDRLQGEASSLKSELNNSQIDVNSLKNEVNHLKTEDNNLESEYNNLKGEVNTLKSEIGNLKGETSALGITAGQIGNQAVTAAMQTRLLLSKRFYSANAVQPHSRVALQAKSFAAYLEEFKGLHPHLYETWASANFGKNLEEYRHRPEFSCAVEARIDARLFSGFVAPYLYGRILDVGCGPYAVPIYLRGYPSDSISGVDPLEPFEPHPFEFVQGFAEFLPWGDRTFDVAIAATSLDHTLDLERALSEIRRVLRPGGFLLVWDWFSDQAEPYNPSEKSPELIDRYHLFNFTEDWFDELMCKSFVISEKMRLFGEYYHYHYYALKLKET